nr:glycosyltransferase family 2 protein [Brevibacillus agri]
MFIAALTSWKGVTEVSSGQLPLVSIVTPSFNQAKFIRETINSVLLQDYPNLEMIVIDGGSTDGTLAILQEYANADSRFRYISEPDNGQSHALNKGFTMSQGTIIGWLNSDDTYLPGAIRKAVNALLQHPAWGMVHGKCQVINEHSQAVNTFPSSHADSKQLYYTCCICQPAAFIRRHVIAQMGGVDEKLHFCMDYELWMRIAKFHQIGFVPEFFANARIHATCKSTTQWHSVGIPEVFKSLAKHYSSIPSGWVSHVSQYRGMGVIDLLKIYKSFPSNSAQVTSMNRFAGSWAPPVLRIIVQSDPANPAHILLIKGQVPAARAKLEKPFHLTALVNGGRAKTFAVEKSQFALEIPLDPRTNVHRVDISSSLITPSSVPSLQNRLVGGYQAEEVIPLSHDEFVVYQTFSRA